MNNDEQASNILKSQESRGVSQMTGITCAMCGFNLNISNRHKVPWNVVTVAGLAIIQFNCPRCNSSYDLATCNHQNSSDTQGAKPTTDQLIDGILKQKQNDNEPLPLIAPYQGMYGKPWTKDDHKRFGVAMERVNEIRKKQNDND